MGKMYIRVIKDGFIYDYNEFLAKNPACEVISEELAYPERFIPPHVIARKTAHGKGSVLDLSTADIPESPKTTIPGLSEEVSRRMPK